jgi:hypothetical protein
MHCENEESEELCVISALYCHHRRLKPWLISVFLCEASRGMATLAICFVFVFELTTGD